MNAINPMFTLSLLMLSACGPGDYKAPVDTGFDLGNTDTVEASDEEQTDPTPENAAPGVSISTPSNGDVLSLDSEITFVAVVSDDIDNPALLELAWSSDRHEELLSEKPADDSGAATFSISSLVSGTHTITLKAVDRNGSISEDSVTIRVEGNNDDDAGSPMNDVDNDGFTTEEGDCNDDDPYTYPGAEEWCDGVDNNCDDVWDTEFYDIHEPNEVMGSATELGEIDEDGLSWGSASITLENLNFDNPEDEDWFVWDADDAWYDDPDVEITVEGDVYTYFVVELYHEEWDTTTPMATVEGWETVNLTEHDFAFDDGWFWETSWDRLFVRVRTTSDAWDAFVCEFSSYSITISS